MKERYYINDLIKELGITKNTYYNWEKAGKVPESKRDPMSNYRYWTEEDIKKLKKLTKRS